MELDLSLPSVAHDSPTKLLATCIWHAAGIEYSLSGAWADGKHLPGQCSLSPSSEGIAMHNLLIVAVALLIPVSLSASEPKVLMEDKFDGKLADGWSWLREDVSAKRFEKGALEIRVEPGLADDAKNVLVRKAPDRKERSYAIEVTVTCTATPTNQYEQAGITWYQAGKPKCKLVHEQIDGSQYIIPGKVPAPEKTVRLRFVVKKDTFTAQFRSLQ